MSFKELEIAIAQSAAEGFTQSEMMTMTNCARKWYLTYVAMLQKKNSFSWSLVYGSAVHSTLEAMYGSKGERWVPAAVEIPKDAVLTLQQQEDFNYWQALVKVQMEAYATYYKDDFKAWEVSGIEQKVDIVHDGLRLKGMIDLLVKPVTSNGYWIVDHKTCSRLDLNTQLGWDFRFQFMFYLWLAKKMNPDIQLKGFIINAIRKPALKQSKKESFESFMERIRFDMISEPEKYFYRDSLPMTKDALERFEKNVLTPKLNRLKLLTDPSIPDIMKNVLVNDYNTDACTHYGVCSFLPICNHGIEAEGFQYTKREHKHEELAEATE